MTLSGHFVNVYHTSARFDPVALCLFIQVCLLIWHLKVNETLCEFCLRIGFRCVLILLLPESFSHHYQFLYVSTSGTSGYTWCNFSNRISSKQATLHDMNLKDLGLTWIFLCADCTIKTSWLYIYYLQSARIRRHQCAPFIYTIKHICYFTTKHTTSNMTNKVMTSEMI